MALSILEHDLCSIFLYGVFTYITMYTNTKLCLKQGVFVSVSPLYCDVYLENIGFVYPAMSMVVIGPSLLY